MATNLLLEGDDLEALLIRAHQEGGPSARIVRAEKVRHGGFFGVGGQMPPFSLEQMSDEDLGALKFAGYDDGQIVEIVLHVGLSILTSYLNKVGDTDIDFPTIKTRRFNHKENCHG